MSGLDDLKAVQKLNSLSDDELKIMVLAEKVSTSHGISFDDALAKIVEAAKALRSVGVELEKWAENINWIPACAGKTGENK